MCVYIYIYIYMYMNIYTNTSIYPSFMLVFEMRDVTKSREGVGNVSELSWPWRLEFSTTGNLKRNIGALVIPYTIWGFLIIIIV